MAAPNNTQFFLNWAKERVSEMDAPLASLESKIGELRAESRAAANEFIANLRTQRDAFRVSVEKQTQMGDIGWVRTKARLENDWASFESRVTQYVENIGRQVGQQQATFELLVAAQLKVWRETAEEIHIAAGQFTADRQRDIDATVERMKEDATAAEEKRQNWHAQGPSLGPRSIPPWRKTGLRSIEPVRWLGTRSSELWEQGDAPWQLQE